MVKIRTTVATFQGLLVLFTTWAQGAAAVTAAAGPASAAPSLRSALHSDGSIQQAARSLQEAAPSSNQTDENEDEYDPVNGPWRMCVGMQADDCVALIESLAEDIYCSVVLPAEPEHTRVHIHVDGEGVVNTPPKRG